MSNLQQAIDDIKDARESHVLWANILTLKGPRPKEFKGKAIDKLVGSAKFHREWVVKYDRVLRTLSAYARLRKHLAKQRRIYKSLGLGARG